VRILVTGSAGHLGEGLVRVLGEVGHDVVGVDVLESRFTGVVGSIADRDCVRAAMAGVDAVIHSATLHKRPRCTSPTSSPTPASTSWTPTSPAR
jgi:UDP-glucose 4-epimerase